MNKNLILSQSDKKWQTIITKSIEVEQKKNCSFIFNRQ